MNGKHIQCETADGVSLKDIFHAKSDILVQIWKISSANEIFFLQSISVGIEAGYDHVHQKPYASDKAVDGEIERVTMKPVELDEIVVCGIW